MQQSKTMGYSALLLLLFCLSSTDGFLEANRRERSTDVNKFNDRNFFGNTWQRFSGTLQERRDRLVRLLPQDDNRQLDNRRRGVLVENDRRHDYDRRISDAREDERISRQTTQRRQIETDRLTRDVVNGRVSRQLDDRRREVRSVSIDNRDRRSDIRDSSRLQSDNDKRQMTRREVRSLTFDNTRRKPVSADSRREIRDQRHSDTRNDRESRQMARREIRSADFDNSRRSASTTRVERVSDNDRRREVRSVSAESRREVRGQRDLDTRESRQMTRREIRSASLDNTRRSPSLTRQSDNDRRLEVRSVSAESRRNPDTREFRQMTRSAIRSFDNTRRSADRREIRSVSAESRREPMARREIRSAPFDNARRSSADRNQQRQSADRDHERITRDFRSAEDRQREVRSISLDRKTSNSQETRIRVSDRRLTREGDRRRVSLSSKDEDKNDSHRYFARNVAERQSKPEERRMATSFESDVTYIPEFKSRMLMNAVQVVLLTFLVAQGISNSSKTKKNWLQNFVTVTKEKVL